MHVTFEDPRSLSTRHPCGLRYEDSDVAVFAEGRIGGKDSYQFAATTYMLSDPQPQICGGIDLIQRSQLW